MMICLAHLVGETMTQRRHLIDRAAADTGGLLTGRSSRAWQRGLDDQNDLAANRPRRLTQADRMAAQRVSAVILDPSMEPQHAPGDTLAALVADSRLPGLPDSANRAAVHESVTAMLDADRARGSARMAQWRRARRR